MIGGEIKLYSVKEYLKKEVKPALGCTEPGAVALAVARARKEVEGENIKKVVVDVSKNVYKNGMYVKVPGTKGMKGNKVAAAVASFCGDPSKKLEVLSDSSETCLQKAKLLLDEGVVNVNCIMDLSGIYIDAKIYTDENFAQCIIKNSHTGIYIVKRNEKIVFFNKENPEENNDFKFSPTFHLDNFIKAVDNIDQQDVEEIFKGIEMNYKVAEHGLKLLGFNEIINQINYKIRYFCMAASGSRMSGSDIPVMSSGGSGNQGIVSILPVAIVGEELRLEKRRIAKAVALSHFVSGFIKSKLGKVAPVCGCVNAASPGAAAGITYLFSGSQEQIMLAVKTVLSDTLGMFCDGAKESCALKAGMAGQEAYDASLLAMRDIGIKDCQGFLNDDFNKTMENIVEIGKNGLTKLDDSIIKVLEKRNS